MTSWVFGLLRGLVDAIGSFFGWKQQRDAHDAGRALERSKQQEKTIEMVREKERIERDLDDPDAARRLLDKHYRD